MRITGGTARGRVIKVPAGGHVRPTTDRMRQTLFNMLNHSTWSAAAGFEIDGAHVLDGFCGTGSLGLEALSRGAADCLFVDFDGRVLQTAKANVKACGFDPQASFMMKGCQSMGPRPDDIHPRDLVMLDPPYRKGLIAPSIHSLAEGGWLADDALVIAESEKGWTGDVPSGIVPVHVRAAGDTALNIFHYRATAAEGSIAS